MNLASIGARNIRRNRTRTLLTVFGCAVAILAFVTIRTLLAMWDDALDAAAADRIATRHKVSLIMSLPKHYVDTIRNIPGIKVASWANWFGGKNPRDANMFFASMAVDSKTFFEVYDELVVPPDQKATWLADRRGAIIGDQLAKQLHVKVGDTFTLEGTIYPGDWQFTIDGVYTTTRKAVDRTQFIFHYDYLNESIPELMRNEVGYVVSRIDSPTRSAELSTAVDRVFDEKDTQTVTMSERALGMSFMAGYSAILQGLNIVSVIILFIMMLILGNTIAMGVRERTHEYGVLRALGFSPRQVGAFVVAEALATGLLGGLVGLGLSYPLVQFGVGRWLEENMGAMFPRFRIDPPLAVLAVLLALLLGALASAIPAMRASRLKVVDALRRVG